MRKSKALEHYGGPGALAAAAGVTRQAVHLWPELIPVESAVALEAASGGALQVEDDAYLLAAVEAARARLSAARERLGT